jgi:putative membrane protein
MQEKLDLILRDELAIERTHLANERTFLAYMRTSFMFLISGLTILKLNYFIDVLWVGWILIGLFPLILLFGTIRLINVRKKVIGMY